MLHTVELTCLYCDGTNLRKHSIVSSGIRRWYCNTCKRTFQQKYRYNARKPGTKEQIIKL